MMSFQSKFNMIAATQSRPPKSTIFPDHSHPTMLVESGQEPGDGTRWKSWKIKKNNKEENKRGRYKTKQRELDQVGQWIEWLLIEDLAVFDVSGFGQSLARGLPDLILVAPYDESRRSVYSRRGWDCHKWQPAVLCVALRRDFYPYDQITTKTENSNHEPKEVPL
ncbi:MAG: hypothetical protein BroJett040_06550 [Oligoflexia bacterium]|nr:MAG: hypothetical protein BroJett040_06550 [Oligoflexia bacterium]